MRRTRTRSAVLLLAGTWAVAPAACITVEVPVLKKMRAVPSVNAVPTPNEAVVIFVRPTNTALEAQSSVFDVPPQGSVRLVGIVAARMKLAHHTAPGPHLFMVQGESADFMAAELQAGRIYLVLVQPRMGAFKPRFTLYPMPIRARQDLDPWLAGATWVENTNESFQWAADNVAPIERKRVEYYPRWLEKPPNQRPMLMPGDGQ